MRLLSFIFIFLLIASCSRQQDTNEKVQSTPSNESLDHEKLAALLMERAKPESDEKILLVAAPGRFDPLIDQIRAMIRESDASFLGVLSITDEQPDSWSTSFTKVATSLADEELRQHIRSADLGIMLPGATPAHTYYAAIQDNLREGYGRTIHFHWAGAYHMDGREKDINEQVDVFYQTALTNTDYEQLAADQRRLEAAMRGSLIRVSTPLGTDISFEVRDRPVTRQDGDASVAKMDRAINLIDREIELPAGAVRVAPVEETVNGVIAFPDSKWNGTTVEGLTLVFENGKVINVMARSSEDAARAELEAAGEAGRSFREFALGMNPQLAIPPKDPWIPYYGYGAGVVRLSLGNNLELGGNVGGGDYVRWNFFTDATVSIGEDVWVEDGKLVK